MLYNRDNKLKLENLVKMNQKELMKILEIDHWEEIQYFEQFLLLMEYYNEIDEDIFFDIFSSLSADNRIFFTESFFEDMMTGIPQDDFSIYKIFSSVKAILTYMAKASGQNPKFLERYVYELLRFQRWITEGILIKCTNLTNQSVQEVNIYDALVLLRIELLNEGKYKIEFPEDLDYSIEEYLYDYEDMNRDDLSDETLIDPENPVIFKI